MAEPLDIAGVLARRKLTRAVAEHVRGLLRSYLTALAPLFHPRTVLGQYVRGESKLTASAADKAFQEIHAAYQSIVRAKRLTLPAELSPPLDVFGGAPELTPSEYAFTPANYDKSIAVTSPLKWTLSYKDLGPHKLRELLTSKAGSASADLQSCLVHNLVMNAIVSRRPGVGDILEALRFKVGVGKHEALPELPAVIVTCPIATVRPPDEVLIQSAELSGTSAFEELVNTEDIANLADPLKEQLLALIGAPA